MQNCLGKHLLLLPFSFDSQKDSNYLSCLNHLTEIKSGISSVESLRSRLPCRYCYALGHAAGALLATGQTGLMATIYDLHLPSSKWQAGGTPLVSMMAVERRKGKDKPVISKALVELAGEPFKAYAAKRAIWAVKDCFRLMSILLQCLFLQSYTPSLLR